MENGYKKVMQYVLKIGAGSIHTNDEAKQRRCNYENQRFS